MKVFVFQGGLGNQIFEYAFYKAQLENYPQLKYLFPKAKCHNGFELDKWFDVTLHKASAFEEVLYIIAQKLKEKGILTLIADKDINPIADNYFVTGYFQTKKYLNKEFIRFKDLTLSEENKRYLNLITHTQSISIHVRRGDYLTPPYDKIYSGICTHDYYIKAINIVKKKIKDPVFFVFSDDIEWVKKNLHLENANYIDCNSGIYSPIDMYLMTFAKANIIANSTFSYWGAYLNTNNPLVIYPKKWFQSRFKTPDIFLTNWLGI